MPRRLIAALSLAAILAAGGLAPTTALAHGGNPNYRSVFGGLSTPLPGVRVRVIGYDALYELRARGISAPVTIYGYDGEPYSRILPDGTVQQNANSRAVYLNNDLYGDAPVPAHAHKGAPVVWKTVDRTATITWHDHRMHYFGKARPAAVKDTHKKTKVFDYAIPLSEGATRSAITGTLFWVGPQDSGFPLDAGVALALLAVGSVVLVVTVRRRRAGSDERRPAGDEAW
jgi:hypothetical protein